jgi:hypothetical protein
LEQRASRHPFDNPPTYLRSRQGKLQPSVAQGPSAAVPPVLRREHELAPSGSENQKICRVSLSSKRPSLLGKFLNTEPDKNTGQNEKRAVSTDTESS